MRIIFFPFFLLFITSCNKSATIMKPQQADIHTQAKSYELQHLQKAYSFRPSIIKFEEGEAVTILYLGVQMNLLGIEKYPKSLYQQYLTILKKEPSLTYIEAKKKINYRRTNYFIDDCPSIGDFLSSLEQRELNYTKPDFDIDLKSPIYKYIYSDKNIPAYYSIVSGVKEHPILKIYNEALKEIENCPHPKDPPKFD